MLLQVFFFFFFFFHFFLFDIVNKFSIIDPFVSLTSFAFLGLP